MKIEQIEMPSRPLAETLAVLDQLSKEDSIYVIYYGHIPKQYCNEYVEECPLRARRFSIIWEKATEDRKSRMAFNLEGGYSSLIRVT